MTQKIFFFFSFLLQKMEHNNDVIMHKKSVIIDLIKDFREIIKQYGFRYKKRLMKNLRRRLRSDRKAADDEDEDDIEYLQEIIDRSSRLKKSLLNKINIMIAVSNIGELKLLSSYLMMMMKIMAFI